MVGCSGRRVRVAGVGRGKVERIAGWTSCHDDRVALSVCWLMKSLFACLSNQMAEQRSQHEQERTRLQQQHSTEKDSLVQEHQRVVDSLETQARATLQQHQQQSQEWRKCDSQVGGVFARPCLSTDTMTHHSPADYHFVFRPLTFSRGFKSPAGDQTFLFTRSGCWDTRGYMAELGGISIFSEYFKSGLKQQGVKRKVWLKSGETGWKTRTGWNFSGVIIFYRLYFITAGFHSRSIANFKSVSAMKSLDMSPIEFFLPVLFAKPQFDFIFHCPFMNHCQTPCTPTDADYYPLTAGSRPPCYFCICKFQGSFTFGSI